MKVNARIIKRPVCGHTAHFFRYRATRCGADAPVCEFSLFCEVGQPYQSSFRVAGYRDEDFTTVEIPESPWLITVKK